VGEVDQLQDSVDEGVTERDQRVDRALRQADQEDGEEVLRLVDQVVPEPDQEEGDQDQPDDRQRRGTLPPAAARRRLLGAGIDRDRVILRRSDGRSALPPVKPLVKPA
jgi:hypothetical protein